LINSNLIDWFTEQIGAANFQRFEAPVLAKLTVVIPSYGRHEYLLRAIIFWSNSPVKIIILDGSPRPLPESILTTVKSLGNVKYVHTIGSIARRLFGVAEHLTTDYAVTMGDDEFHLKTGLEKALSALELNSDVVGCVGQSVSFRSGGDGLVYGKGYPHENYHVDQEAVSDRLYYAMAQYNGATCYAVLRRSCWIRSYGKLEDWSSPYAGEIQQALITYICGKFISVNALYWLRSFDVPPVHGRLFNRKLQFYDWWIDKRYVDEQKKFVSLIAVELLSNGCSSPDEATEIVNAAVKIYLNFCKRESSLNSIKRLNKLQYIKAFTRKYVPERIVELIERVVGRDKVGVYPVDFDYGGLNDLSKAEGSASYALDARALDEMRSIEELVIGFNKKNAP
jgi:glycosyltransferase domain-containing protein